MEDFNIAALRRAAREGRLYIVPAVECETNVEQEVLTYALMSRCLKMEKNKRRRELDQTGKDQGMD